MVKGISEALRDRGASPCDLEARRRAARADRRDECTLVDTACIAAAMGGVALVEIGDEPDVGGLPSEHLAGERARRWAVDPDEGRQPGAARFAQGVGKEACSEHDEIRLPG